MKSIRALNIPNFLKIYIAGFSGLPNAAWPGIIIFGIESILVGICYFLTLYFVTHLHFTVFQASIIISAYGIGTIFGALGGGKLSDIYSPRKIAVISLFIQAIAYFSLIYNNKFYYLIINLFFLGVGSYAFITSNNVWVLATCYENEKQRLKVISLLNVASNLGLGIAAIFIGCFLAQEFKYLFLFSSFLLTSIAIYALNLKNPIHKQKELSHKNNYVKNSFNQAIIYYTLGCLFIVGIIIAQTNSTYPVFLAQIFPSMGIKSFSILFTLNTFMVVFFQPLIVQTFAHFKKVHLIGMSSFLMGMGILILCYTSHFSIAVVSMFILTMGEILFFAISQLICYENSESHQKGQGLGIYRMIFASSRIVGPVFGGFIYQQLGGNILWYICFLMGLCCLLPAFWLADNFVAGKRMLTIKP
jgi:MFS family permease